MMRVNERTAWTAGYAMAVWAVISWPIWFALTAVAGHIGGWVGGGQFPLVARLIWFAPAVIGIAGGAAAALAGFLLRWWLVALAGGFALASGVFLYLVAGGVMALMRAS